MATCACAIREHQPPDEAPEPFFSEENAASQGWTSCLPAKYAYAHSGICCAGRETEIHSHGGVPCKPTNVPSTLLMACLANAVTFALFSMASTSSTGSCARSSKKGSNGATGPFILWTPSCARLI